MYTPEQSGRLDTSLNVRFGLSRPGGALGFEACEEVEGFMDSLSLELFRESSGSGRVYG